MGSSAAIMEILNNGSLADKKALFAFDNENSEAEVLLKFNLWARYFFPQYFSSQDAPFHKEIDANNLGAYDGTLSAFVDIAFRGAAKTARTKLFLAYCIANDLDHYRRYIKILAADGENSKQIVTDIYNVFMAPEVAEMYPEVFQKTGRKREETMGSFTTSTGVKVIADTVGTDQRGALQEAARPDFILFEDFENRKTLRSAKTTRSIWENMEEARTSLAKGGACVYNCNYISELGNVHTLVTKGLSDRKKVLIVPIVHSGVLAWPDRFTEVDIAQMRKEDEDFEGERLCKPSKSKDVLFDRDTLDKMEGKDPVRELGGLKIFYQYNASHRYGTGHDVAGGVGLDSSTTCAIDFSVNPARVCATYANNEVKPDVFGDDVKKHTDVYGGCIAGVEKNNYGHATIARAKQLGVRLYRTQGKKTRLEAPDPTEYGWDTNALTKPSMMSALVKAVEDGLLELTDPALIAEAKSYSRNDLIDTERDPRMTTRHFDLLIACAIAWQMKDFATVGTATTSVDAEMRQLMNAARNKSPIAR